MSPGSNSAHVGAVLKALVPKIIDQSREGANIVFDEAVKVSGAALGDTKAKVLY